MNDFECNLDYAKLTIQAANSYTLFSCSIKDSASNLPDGVKGFGFDENPELAKTKAKYELYERIAFCKEFPKGPPSSSTSNGYAAHTTADGARNHAILELIERHTFLYSWFHKLPVLEVNSVNLSKLSPVVCNDVKYLRDLGFEIQAGFIAKSADLFVSYCRLMGYGKDRPFGSIISTGISQNPSLSIKNAVLDNLRNWELYRNGLLHKEINDKNITNDSNSKWTIKHHRRFHLNPQNKQYTDWYFGNLTDNLVEMKSIQSQAHIIHRDKSIPLYIYRATSDDPIFFDLVAGHAKASYNRADLNIDHLNSIHPFC